MICPACSVAVGSGAKFCSNCGLRLSLACPACQAAIAENQPSCANCGRTIPTGLGTGESLATHASRDSAGIVSRHEGDRRVVTVLFTDVSGFTALSERIDPEEVTEIVNNFFRVLSEPIYRYGGIVDKYIGDAIMALFGAPVAHEDDPERAVLASWEMQVAGARHAIELENRTGINLQVRIGLNTGLVVAGAVGGSQRSDYTVMGDTVNLAQRMEANARPGKILVTAETHAATRHAFNYTEMEPIRVKGRSEQVAVFEVAGVKSRTTKLQVEGPFTLIGREDELGRMRSCVDTVLSGRPQWLSLVGGVGVGKSTVASAFLKMVGRVATRIIYGHALSYEQQTGYSVIAALLHNWLDLPEHASSQDVADAVATFAANTPSIDARGESLFRHLLSLPIQNEEIRSLSPKQQRTAAFLALNDALLEHASKGLVLVSLEDLHWADEASLEWLQSLADRLGHGRESLLIVLCQSRPKSAYLELALGERLDLTKIFLKPLDRDGSYALTTAVLGVRPETLGTEGRSLVEQVLARAEGNPYYLTQLLHSLIDSGVLIRVGPTWGVSRHLGEFKLPTTVQGAIAARLDRLNPDLRRIIQVASVIGRSFDLRLLATVLESDPVSGVLELAEQGFFENRKSGGVAFTQAMTQEVAYQNLLISGRRDLHCRIALAIEEAARDDPVPAARVLAFHYVRAEVSPKACHYLLLAANQARLGFALAEALGSYRQALDWMDRAGGTITGLDRAEILWGLAAVEVMKGDHVAALEHLEAALQLSPTGPWAKECHRQAIKALIRKGDIRRALALVEDRLEHENEAIDRATLLTTRAEILSGQGLLEQAEAACHEALSLLEATDRKKEMAGVYNVLGNTAYLKGSPAAIEYYQRNLALREAIRDVPGLAAGLNNLALAQAACGQWPTAVDAYVRALKIYNRIGDVVNVANSQINLGDLLLSMGRIPEAEKTFLNAKEIYTRLGNPLGEASAANSLGKLALATGQGKIAIESLRRSFELLTRLGARTYAAEVLRNLGHAYLLAGDHPRARETLEQAIALAKAADNEQEVAIARTLVAELMALAGDLTRAVDIVCESVASLRTLGNVLELGRAQVRAARIHQAAGDKSAATRATQEAKKTFESLGAAIDLAAARAVV